MDTTEPKKQKPNKSLVWDLPTRLFHWFFVLCFISAWITHDNDRFLFEHVYAGYVFFGLLIFRFFWGWIGSYYALFRTFAYDWPSVSTYIKGLLSGEATRYIGHNPAGGWAIFAMLALGLLVSITGLLVFGGEEGHGPLKDLISYDVGNAAKELHEILAFIMLAVVFIHVSGVIFESLFHKENLIWAMITGHKPPAEEVKKVRIYKLTAIVMVTAMAISTTMYFRGYISQTDAKPFIPFSSPPLPSNATWETECGECHLAFHPTLLPARSWQLMMQQQENHFEEDLAYDEDVVLELTNFMVNFASESGLTEPANKISRSVPLENIPLRITETQYWKRKHSNIADKYWNAPSVKSKTNCAACHLDASKGRFEDSNMRLPKLTKEK